MTHTQCTECRRRNIVVEKKSGVDVLAHHYRKGGRKGGTCRATGIPLAPAQDAA